MSFDVHTAIAAADRTWPEPVSLPDDLADASPLQLAEARSRLVHIIQVAGELRELIDAELAGVLQGSAFRYGDDLLRPSAGRGSAKIADPETWWPDVVEGLQASHNPEGLLAALYPASAVRLTALPKLAAALSCEVDDLRGRHVVYDPPTSPLTVMPMTKAPKFLADLAEGELRPV